jgi:hypothetical protein
MNWLYPALIISVAALILLWWWFLYTHPHVGASEDWDVWKEMK